MKYILDTNIISELIAKQPDPNVVAWVDSRDPASIYLSVITIGEIRKGIEKLATSKRKEALRDWLESDLLHRFQGRIVGITVEVMWVWGTLTARLEAEGRPLAAIDSLIAAIALHGGYTLVTRNEADFQGTGVKIVNPWDKAWFKLD